MNCEIGISIFRADCVCRCQTLPIRNVGRLPTTDQAPPTVTLIALASLAYLKPAGGAL